MCTGAEIAIIAAAVAGTGTAIYSGQQQAKAAGAQAAALSEQAAQEQEAAKAEADRLRQATRFKRGEARAALAASGVDVDSQTATLIDQTIVSNDEQDAFNLLLTGQRRAGSLSAESQLSLRAGRDAATAGYLDAANTALGAYSGYKRRQPGYQTSGGG